jgi:hypothetical protein
VSKNKEALQNGCIFIVFATPFFTGKNSPKAEAFPSLIAFLCGTPGA